jgi:hypothetical protein
MEIESFCIVSGLQLEAMLESCEKKNLCHICELKAPKNFQYFQLARPTQFSIAGNKSHKTETL